MSGQNYQESKKSGECEVQLTKLGPGHCQPRAGHDIWQELPDCLSPPHLLRQSYSLFPRDER